MRKFFATLAVLFLVGAPLAVQAATSSREESNAPRIERRESNAPRGQDAGAPRSLGAGVPDRVDQGNPAP